MAEVAEATPAVATKKKETEYIKVTMTDTLPDGSARVVEFPLDTKAKKTILYDASDKPIGVRFDFSNGQTRTVLLSQVEAQRDRLAVHGLSQKGGDSYASEKDVEDAVLALDDTLDVLLKGEWSEGREGGFGGQSVLMKACMEHFQQTAEAVKEVLKGMKPKEKQQLRQADGIREIVQRIEAEKAAGSKVDVAALKAKFAGGQQAIAA